MSKYVPTQTLGRYIQHRERSYPDASGELSALLTSIGLAVKAISYLVATAGFKGLHGFTGETNVQGEQVRKLDGEADDVLMDILGQSGHFGSLVSEERDDAISTDFSSQEAKYVVAFDPLDGSSNIGTNIPVGTIFCIFKKSGGRDGAEGSPESHFLQSGRSIVAAGYSVYGAKTSFVYSCGDGVHDFTLDPSLGEFVLTGESLQMPESGDTYSVNEGYWSLWSDELKSYIQSLKEPRDGSSPYSARYVGSLVADFDRTLRKGGIFLHPANNKRTSGKLRLLYECLPLAYIAEQAGGKAVDMSNAILDRTVQNIHERAPFIAGSRREVEYFLNACRS